MDRADRPFLAAVVQMSSTSSEEGNWRQVKSLIERAAQLGAQLVVTPENTNYLGPHEEKVRRAEPLGGPTCAKFAHLADELDIHLLLGSFNERGSQPGRCRNTSVLFGLEGEILAVYRKIHLFDVDVADAVRFLESATVEPGEEVVVAETPLGKIGLSICYDLRFGELYRKLVAGGAEMIAIPAAFTAVTGKAHWEPLIRARAIESQCYVLAAAQCGKHDDNGLRESHGHAMIVDPWGQVVASVSDGPGVAVAEIDLDRVARVRAGIPISRHRRL